MPTSEHEKETTTDSVETKAEDLREVDNIVSKKESSFIDEILSVESVTSVSRLDGDTNNGVEQQKEVCFSSKRYQLPLHA